ncbi:hypothetical protein SAMN06265370_108173 [Puniceibacterium sediminis]|uniref:Uncharacterized protein n=1 Tax=Puniceibacterium sediminis TaxID=1608407 RepID=A0A238X0V7_9RHOB|nr:hypothetical protein SAMN06265370_108173 [Puniceibacterium sediminis]
MTAYGTRMESVWLAYGCDMARVVKVASHG